MGKKNSIKTYRVLKDGQLVGDSKRDYGDFMPEAEHMDNLGVLLRADVIERAYVSQREFDDWRERQDKKDKKWRKELDEIYGRNSSAPPKVKIKKKSVAKNTVVAKKRVIKKKGKTRGLAEQSV